MSEQFIVCPKCHAGLTAKAQVDYFKTKCACCGAGFSVMKDENELLEEQCEVSRWDVLGQLKAMLP